MPIYEYRCNACEQTVDVLQKLSDPPLGICPECESPGLRRLISAPSFRLKGGGWYETDFKSDKDRKRNLAESRERSDVGNDGSKEKPAAADDKSSGKKETKETKETKEKPDSGKSESKPKASSVGKDAGKVA